MSHHLSSRTAYGQDQIPPVVAARSLIFHSSSYQIRTSYANVISIPELIYYYKTMVDVDMADAGSSAPTKGKLVGPAKGKSPEGGGLDGKKRFEVKKVGSRFSAMEGRD